ncbi:hypothetical protein VKT23_011551 [Stygiomarasmius scandens]|uniref:Uncharacterized protein n=1 Tax=Marasmiellus scandens TaxID=2682957 RepID=A0ABR1J9F8_9AGAR
MKCNINDAPMADAAVNLTKAKDAFPEYRPLHDVPPIANTNATGRRVPEYVLGWELPSRDAYYDKYIRPVHGSDGYTELHDWHEDVMLKKWREKYGREFFSDFIPRRVRNPNGRYILAIGSNATRNEIKICMRRDPIAAGKDVFKMHRDPQWIRVDVTRD